MASHRQKIRTADSRSTGPDAGIRKFAGKAALVSAMSEAAEPYRRPIETNFSLVPDQMLGSVTSEQELSDMVGAPMRIVPERSLRVMIGQDEADRFIAGIRTNKKSR